MCRIIEVIEELAPISLSEEWDNVGLLVGRQDADISRALIALDVLDSVIDEALACGATAIISHHPLIFSPLNRINDANPLGKRLMRLIENGICVYAAHTNLDTAEGGINDMLFDTLGFTNKEHVCETRPGVFVGRAGTPSESITLSELAKLVQNKLGLSTATYCGLGDAKVSKIGLIAGSSANPDFFKGAIAAGCDTFITSDIKFAMAQAASDMGLNLIDATHYGSEALFAGKLVGYLAARLPNVEFIASEVDGQIFKTVCSNNEVYHA